MSDLNGTQPARFDLRELIGLFPDRAESLLLDRYLVDHATASARLFRVYRPTPAHFHRHSDEHLYVLSGRGSAWLRRPEERAAFEPGHFLYFPRETVHAMPALGSEAVVFLAIDTPRRRPEDVVFVDGEQGTPEAFLQPAR